MTKKTHTVHNEETVSYDKAMGKYIRLVKREETIPVDKDNIIEFFSTETHAYKPKCFKTVLGMMQHDLKDGVEKRAQYTDTEKKLQSLEKDKDMAAYLKGREKLMKIEQRKDFKEKIELYNTCKSLLNKLHDYPQLVETIHSQTKEFERVWEETKDLVYIEEDEEPVQETASEAV